MYPYSAYPQQGQPTNNLYNYQSAQQGPRIPRVTGRNGASAYNMPPNSEILLLDETSATVWLKTTDGAGYPTLTPYDIIPAQTQEQKEASRYEALEKRIALLEDLLNEQSNTRSVKSEQNHKSGSTN